MLLDCQQLSAWNCEQQFNQMFEFNRDYMPWIGLKLEARDNIALFEEQWNDFDHLTANTKLLHNTKRKTQPWKTGLPVDYRPAENEASWSPLLWAKKARRAMFGEYGLLGEYKPHPDPAQEAFFFGLLKECLQKGIVTETLLQEEMRQNHVRHDALEVLEAHSAIGGLILLSPHEKFSIECTRFSGAKTGYPTNGSNCGSLRDLT